MTDPAVKTHLHIFVSVYIKRNMCVVDLEA